MASRSVPVSAYRDYLLPAVRAWRDRSARVAVFGTGEHTDALLDAVPELADCLVGFVQTCPPRGETTFRGLPLRGLDWADDHADVVVCSSFVRELEQLDAMRARRPKTVLSHPPHWPVAPAPAAADAPDLSRCLVVPTFGYPVVLDPGDRRAFDALATIFDGQLPAMRRFVDRLRPYFRALDAIPDEKVDDATPFWKNGYFSGADARVAYAMVRAFRPARIVEIGSGNSTLFLRRAVADNGGGTTIASIDPEPRRDIDCVCDRVVRLPLQRVPLSLFDELRAGDFLFFDGSHLVFQGSDCVHFFLRILPALARGVHVHVHDIHLPNGYSDEFDRRFYNEQFVLAALLLGDSDWRIRVPVAYLRERGVLEGERVGGSFWMQRPASGAAADEGTR